jgi:hypothetical protein
MGDVISINGEDIEIGGTTEMTVHDVVALLMAVDYVLEDLDDTPDEQFDDAARLAYTSLITVKAKIEIMLELDNDGELH